MKKLFVLSAVALLSCFASAKTFVDKTTTEHLNYRILDSGQLTWNEEDGGVVFYMGGRSEMKNLRVIDPTTIRGYRRKTSITDLALNGSENLEMIDKGFRYTHDASAPQKVEYNDLQSRGSLAGSFSTKKSYAAYNPVMDTYVDYEWLPIQITSQYQDATLTTNFVSEGGIAIPKNLPDFESIKTNWDPANYMSTFDNLVNRSKSGSCYPILISISNSNELNAFYPHVAESEIDTSTAANYFSMYTSWEDGIVSIKTTTSTTKCSQEQYIDKSSGMLVETTQWIVRQDPDTVTSSVDTLNEFYPVTIFEKVAYWEATVDVYSKDANIELLDYLYEYEQSPEREGTIGNFEPFTMTRDLIYDGRTVHLTIKIYSVQGDEPKFEVRNFVASCMGIGDTELENDTTMTTYMIKDNLGSYNLAELREWVNKQVNANSGQNWSKYAALSDVVIGKYNLILRDSKSVAVVGMFDGSLQFSLNGAPMMNIMPGKLSEDGESISDGVLIQLTDIKQDPTTKAWTLEFMTSTPVPIDKLSIMYREKLGGYKEDGGIWNPINCVVEDISGGSQTAYRVSIPMAYTEKVTTGFFRIGTSGLSRSIGNIQLKTTLSVTGDDGKLYRLKIPAGGGVGTWVPVEE